MAPLFFVLFGVSLIIPNSLSIALKAYGHALGSAGSILGAIYYVQIALMCALMSYLHNGTPQVMPLYFFTLSLLLLYAGKRVVTSQKVSAASGAG